MFNYSPILEYDFEKQSNTKCDPLGEAFNTLDDAQNACKSSKQCQGITNDTSSDQKKYHLCAANATITLGIDINTSFHKKIIIGKSFSKWYTQNRLISFISPNKLFIILCIPAFRRPVRCNNMQWNQCYL